MPSQKDGVARPAIEKLRTSEVDPAVLPQRRDRAERDRDDDRDDRRDDRDLERDRQAGRDLDDDRLARPHRVAEIEGDQAPQEIEILQDPGPVDADFGVAGGQRGGREAGAARPQAHQADVARNQAHQHEDQRRGAEQGRDDQKKPSDDVAEHLRLETWPELRSGVIRGSVDRLFVRAGLRRSGSSLVQAGDRRPPPTRSAYGGCDARPGRSGA